jgi:hypothetical protein
MAAFRFGGTNHSKAAAVFVAAARDPAKESASAQAVTNHSEAELSAAKARTNPASP